MHVVFAQYVRQAKSIQNGTRHRIALAAILHRKSYYWLIIFLERRAYTSPEIALILIAKKTAVALEEFYGRRDPLPVVYVGLDHEIFNPARRDSLREAARRALGLAEESSLCS